MQPSTLSHSLAHGIPLENPPRPSHTLRTLASHSCVPIGHGGSPVELLLAVISPVLLALVSPVPGPVLIVVVPVVPGSVMPVLPGSVLTVSLAPLGLLVVSAGCGRARGRRRLCRRRGHGDGRRIGAGRRGGAPGPAIIATCDDEDSEGGGVKNARGDAATPSPAHTTIDAWDPSASPSPAPRASPHAHGRVDPRLHRARYRVTSKLSSIVARALSLSHRPRRHPDPLAARLVVHRDRRGHLRHGAAAIHLTHPQLQHLGQDPLLLRRRATRHVQPRQGVYGLSISKRSGTAPSAAGPPGPTSPARPACPPRAAARAPARAPRPPPHAPAAVRRPDPSPRAARPSPPAAPPESSARRSAAAAPAAPRPPPSPARPRSPRSDARPDTPRAPRRGSGPAACAPARAPAEHRAVCSRQTPAPSLGRPTPPPRPARAGDPRPLAHRVQQQEPALRHHPVRRDLVVAPEPQQDCQVSRTRRVSTGCPAQHLQRALRRRPRLEARAQQAHPRDRRPTKPPGGSGISSASGSSGQGGADDFAGSATGGTTRHASSPAHTSAAASEGPALTTGPR